MVSTNFKGRAMKKEHIQTHITIILDRTGSMEIIRDDVIGGFNTFLENQQKEEDIATLTLVQFDSQDPYEVIHEYKPIAKIPKLSRETYVPRASTPLLDAMGRGINDLEKNLADMKKNERPGKVVMVIITDGQENSSVEFKKDQIVRMIRDKQEKNKWQFVFLSADLDAISDAEGYGFKNRAMMAFDSSSAGVHDAFASLSQSISSYRSDLLEDVGFDEKDREKQQIEKKRKGKNS